MVGMILLFYGSQIIAENIVTESSIVISGDSLEVISEQEVRERLSYLLKYEFVKEQTKNDKIVYSVDAEKLSKIMENEENYASVTDGLTKMDSFLN